MVLDYMRLLLAMILTLSALMVALNRHHMLLGAISRLTDLAADRRPHVKSKIRPRMPARESKADLVDPSVSKGNWRTGRGQAIEIDDDDDDWLVVDNED